jgi:hypothetical protein
LKDVVTGSFSPLRVRPVCCGLGRATDRFTAAPQAQIQDTGVSAERDDFELFMEGAVV